MCPFSAAKCSPGGRAHAHREARYYESHAWSESLSNRSSLLTQGPLHSVPPSVGSLTRSQSSELVHNWQVSVTPSACQAWRGKPALTQPLKIRAEIQGIWVWRGLWLCILCSMHPSLRIGAGTGAGIRLCTWKLLRNCHALSPSLESPCTAFTAATRLPGPAVAQHHLDRESHAFSLPNTWQSTAT